MRPSDLPPPEYYAHGTRARYVAGCRCPPCRASNVAYYHERQRRGKELAAQIVAPERSVSQTWTARDGTKRERQYRRACPGPGDGVQCPKRAHLRKDSKGGVCGYCRGLLVWNGLVDARSARRHLRTLSRRGVGYKSVATATDVSRTVIADILSGRKRQIRARTAKRILAVTPDALADHALVPAKRTWRLVGRLREEGFTKGEISRRLGHKRLALQIGKERVLARTALAIEKLYRLTVEVPT